MVIRITSSGGSSGGSGFVGRQGRAGIFTASSTGPPPPSRTAATGRGEDPTRDWIDGIRQIEVSIVGIGVAAACDKVAFGTPREIGKMRLSTIAAGIKDLPPLHGRGAVVHGLGVIVASIADFGREGTNIRHEGLDVFSCHLA